MWGTLPVPPLELGGSFVGPMGLRCSFGPALRGGLMDWVHVGGFGGVSSDCGPWGSSCAAAFLGGVVGGIADGFLNFLSFDQHASLVVFARLREELGRLGSGFDHRVARLSPDLDLPAQLGDF